MFSKNPFPTASGWRINGLMQCHGGDSCNEGGVVIAAGAVGAINIS